MRLSLAEKARLYANCIPMPKTARCCRFRQGAARIGRLRRSAARNDSQGARGKPWKNSGAQGSRRAFLNKDLAASRLGRSLALPRQARMAPSQNSWQGNLLPALRAEPDVSLDKFPNHQPFALEEFRPSCKFLTNQCGSPSVIDNGSQRTPELQREMRNESSGGGRIFLVDPEKTVSKYQYRRVRIVLIGLAIISLTDLIAEYILRRVGFLNPRVLDHLRDIAMSDHHHGFEGIFC